MRIGVQPREDQHAFGEATRQSRQGPCATEAHGISLPGMKHEHQGPNKELQGKIEESNKEGKRGKRAR